MMKTASRIRLSGNVYWISPAAAARQGAGRRARAVRWMAVQAGSMKDAVEQLLHTHFPQALLLALLGGAASAGLLSLL